MSGHTKGPWSIAPGVWIVCDSDGGSVADCEPPGPWISNEVADANARLIAAAPDMLAALQAIIGTSGGLYCTYEKQQQVKAAIAKATGEGS